MEKNIASEVAWDTASFFISSVGLKALDLNVHMGIKDYLGYAVVDTLLRYTDISCTFGVTKNEDINTSISRIFLLTGGKSIIDLFLDRQGKLKQNALAIAGSEPVRAAVNYARMRF